jgi:hypothetical protein
MRKGIVAGEPGMFPWPFGRLYGLVGRWLRGRHSQPGHELGTEAGSQPDYRPSPDDDQARPPEPGGP